MNYRLALTLAMGIALGAAAFQVLHAQNKPPVYVIVDISEVTDPGGEKANTERTNSAAAALLTEFGGRFLARTNQISALDGATPKRILIIAFDSTEQARGWYNSPAQQQVNARRLKATKSRAFIVEGM